MIFCIEINFGCFWYKTYYSDYIREDFFWWGFDRIGFITNPDFAKL